MQEHSIPSYSCTGGHSGWFCVLAAAVSVAAVQSLWHTDFIILEYMPSSKIAGSYDGSIFSSLRNPHAVFLNVCANLLVLPTVHRVLYSPPSRYPGSPCFAFFFLPHSSHSTWTRVIAHNHFPLHFSGDYWFWDFFFMCPFCHFYLILRTACLNVPLFCCLSLRQDTFCAFIPLISMVLALKKKDTPTS